jgi:hypothetical protein
MYVSIVVGCMMKHKDLQNVGFRQEQSGKPYLIHSSVGNVM